jgi:hypothetical protein
LRRVGEAAGDEEEEVVVVDFELTTAGGTAAMT